MFKLNKISTPAAILALSVLVSCVEMEEPQNGSVGYLAAPSLAVDVTVDDLVLTKAAPALSSVQMPDSEVIADGVTFVVREKGSDVDLLDGNPWTDALTLVAGKTYVVEAYYGENGFATPCFAGSQEITIEPLVAATPDLTLTVANALLCVTTDALDGHFTVTKIELASGVRSDITKSEGDFIYSDLGEQIYTLSGQVEDKWIWVPAGKPLSVTVKGTNEAGNESSFVYDALTPAAGTAYNIVCGKPADDQWPSIDWTEIPLSAGAFEGGLYFKAAVASNMSPENAGSLRYQIKGGEYSDWEDVTVADVEGYKYISGLENGTEYTFRACVGNIFSEELAFSPVSYASCLSTDVTTAHNNTGNPSAMLESTSVSAAVSATLPAIVAELSTAQTAKVTFGNGRVKQTTLNVNAAEQVLSNADGWPYLPQGSYTYTAEVTCTLPGGRTVTADLSASVTVPAPEFTLTVSAYTTYDRYSDHLNGVEGALAKANTLANRMLVEERKATLAISNDILKNENYKSLLTKSEVKYAGSSLSTFSANTSNALTYDNVTAGALGTYDFTAAVTFDGVAESASHPCHITGLPYTADFTVSQDLTGWYLHHTQGGSHKCAYNTSKTDGYELAYGYTNKATCNMFSPEFMLPTSVHVGYSVNVSWWQTGTKLVNGDSVLHVGITSGTSVNSQKTLTLNEASEVWTGSIESKGTLSNEEAVLANMQRVSIYVDSQDWGISTEHFVVLSYFHIEYK